MESNPYQPPVAETAVPPAVAPRLYPASAGQRFLNFVIDYIAVMVLGAIVVVVLTLALGENIVDQLIDQIPDFILNIVLISTYYVLFEALTGRTLGKLVTRARVVSTDDKGLSFGRIFVRTLSRCVPFEAFSAFGDGQMWHDSWSRTAVMTTRAPKYISDAEP